MTDADRRKMYEALLIGLTETAQKQLCAKDEQHAWGPWRRYQVQHDNEDYAPAFDPAAPMIDAVIHIAAERRCLCCGKVQNG